MSTPARRAPGLGAAAAVGVTGTVWMCRWISPRLTLDTGSGPLWRQHVSRPLLISGVVALVFAVTVAVVLWRRPRGRPVVTAVVIGVCGLVVLGAGEARYRWDRNPWPRLRDAARTVPAPASWGEVAHRNSEKVPPAAIVVWTAPTRSPAVACAELGDALRRWPGITNVKANPPIPSLGLACGYVATRHGTDVHATVTNRLVDIGHSQIAYGQFTGEEGPAVAIELATRVAR